jgi:predicted nucleic acid-binding protein
MKLVVDTNILFSFFWKNSFTRKSLINQDLELISPEYALEEISRHSDEIIRKLKISLKEFEKIRKELAIMVEFIPSKEYSKYLKKALKFSPDKDDIDFFALALKYKISVWSNDKALKRQKVVNVISTEDLVENYL